MVYIIIGLIAIVVVIGLIGALLSFMWEHKVFCVIAIIVVGGIIYYVNADKPLYFLPAWGENIKKFAWNITYKNTVFDSIWIYGLLLFFVWLTAKILLGILSKESLKLALCTSFAGIALVINFIFASGLRKIICPIEVLLSVAILWMYYAQTMDKIGMVKDVSDTFIKIEIPMLQLAIWNMISVANIAGVANSYFYTKIPQYIPVMLISLVFIAIELKWFIHTFIGYQYIVGFVKGNGFFSFNDYCKNDRLSYLIDPNEYVLSVTEILLRKKKIYELPSLKNWYFNQALEKKIEKYVKSNLSSDEIKSKIDTDFREFSFDTIYQMMFSKVKGYEIDFSESADSKKRRKSEVGIGAIEFVLMRYPIEKHPILEEGKSVKEMYIAALNYLVSRGPIDKAKWSAKIEEYQKVFGIDEIKTDPSNAIEFFASIVIRKQGYFKKIKSDYSYLLLLEGIYFENLLTNADIQYKEIEETFEKLKIKRAHRDFIYQYIKFMFIDGDIVSAEGILQTKVKMDVRRVLEYIHHNIMWNEKYVVSKQYNVAVCATMGAGKSTFINSLLGIDFIPAKNEACTAKVTTIRDNDNLEKLIGCYSRNDGTKVYSNIIDKVILNNWNDDNEVRETILEGDIEDISCKNKVLIMHDTPGTNNSEDLSHHDRTIEFVQKNALESIIYLINAEYISTTDTEILLKEIQDILKQHNTKIVFGLNKIDAFDEENENLNDAILGLIEQLKTYGFEQPIVFPFSANAARLFKMVINSNELTKREKRNIYNLYEYFSKFDASKYIVNTTSSKSSNHYTKLKKDKMINIEDNDYSYNGIVAALENTGILCIEHWIEEQMNET